MLPLPEEHRSMVMFDANLTHRRNWQMRPTLRIKQIAIG